MTAEKVRENLLRRMAARRGLVLVKSRRRDKGALDFNRFALIDAGTKSIVFGADASGLYIASMDQIAADLEAGRRAAGTTAQIEHQAAKPARKQTKNRRTK